MDRIVYRARYYNGRVGMFFGAKIKKKKKRKIVNNYSGRLTRAQFISFRIFFVAAGEKAVLPA